jgi:hypothetical protein
MSWLAQLFSRNKPRAAAASAAPRAHAAPDTVQRPRNGEPQRAALQRSAEQAPPRRPTDGGERLPEAPTAVLASREDATVKTTRMAPQEELSLKVNEGIKNLSTLLSAIDQRMVQQTRATELVAERLQTLPRVLEGLVEVERTNLETLRELRGSMEKQGQAAAQTAEKLSSLPGLVEGLGTRVEKQTEAAASVRTSVESVGQSVRGLVDGTQRAQNSLITEFRRGQDQQQQHLIEMVDRQRKTIYAVAVLGVFVIVCLLIVLMRLPR